MNRSEETVDQLVPIAYIYLLAYSLITSLDRWHPTLVVMSHPAPSKVRLQPVVIGLFTTNGSTTLTSLGQQLIFGIRIHIETQLNSTSSISFLFLFLFLFLCCCCFFLTKKSHRHSFFFPLPLVFFPSQSNPNKPHEIAICLLEQ